MCRVLMTDAERKIGLDNCDRGFRVLVRMKSDSKLVSSWVLFNFRIVAVLYTG